MSNDTSDPMELFKRAFAQHDAVLFARLLEEYPEMKARINDPVAAFDAPARVNETIGEFSRAQQIIDCFLPVADKLKRSWNANLGKSTFEEQGVGFVIFSNQNCFFVSHIVSVALFFVMRSGFVRVTWTVLMHPKQQQKGYQV